ncbi:MAG: hypothetical protein AB7O76_15080 [Rhizobiaceae bacterium]
MDGVEREIAVVDHGESERRMLRIDYLVRAIRANIIAWIANGVSATVFATVGLRGIYPPADRIIDALAPQVSSGSPEAIGRAINLAFTVALFLAFGAWMLRAILRLHRRSLKAIAILWAAGIPILLLGVYPAASYALERLDAFHVVLVGLVVAFNLYLGLDVVRALWGASTAPSDASFRAAADRRLASGRWSYFNKLADLPRTPLKSPRSLAAYGMTFAAALILVGSMTTLLSLDGIHARIMTIAANCPAPTWGCPQFTFGRGQILTSIALALGGLAAAGLLRGGARRLGGLSVGDALRSSSGRFILYLRPFEVDEVRLPKPKLPLLGRLIAFLPYRPRVEEELFDVTDGYLPLIAIGRPGVADATGGVAHRDHLGDDTWQDYIAARIRGAEAIVVVLGETEGIRWEVSQIVGQGMERKTLFMLHPSARTPGEWRRIMSATLALIPGAPEIGIVEPYVAKAIAFHFGPEGLTLVVNDNWSTVSYRTAFSTFLAERTGHP